MLQMANDLGMNKKTANGHDRPSLAFIAERNGTETVAINIGDEKIADW